MIMHLPSVTVLLLEGPAGDGADHSQFCLELLTLSVA